MRRYLLIVAILLLHGSTAFAQDFLAKPKKGTYQIQMVRTKSTVHISDQQMAGIEARRQQSEDVVWEINDQLRVLILSKDKVKATSFKPIPSQRIYRTKALYRADLK